MKILLVEDDENLSKFLNQSLKSEGYDIDIALDGNKGLELATINTYKVILLDIMLPGMNGLEILRELRSQKDSTPILMLTARNDVSDKVEGLNFGADDYLGKPFSFEELTARLNALIRRSSISNEYVIRYENIELDTIQHIARKGNEEITLTIKEYELLELLMRNANKIISRKDITKFVWKQDDISDSNVIDVYIKRLRQKLGSRENGSQFIKSIRGIGYIFGDIKENG